MNLYYYNEFINESYFWDYLKNLVRKKDNPNVVAEEVFNKIKNDIKRNIDVLTTVKQEEEGVLEITLSNRLKIKIILVYDELGNQEEAILYMDSPKRKEEDIKLRIDFSRGKRYIDYIKEQKRKKYNKALKVKQSKEARKRMENL